MDKGTLTEYIDQHTGWTGGTWEPTDPAERGLYPFGLAGSTRKDEFLERLHEHGEGHPLDGREHDLHEMTRWLGERSHVLAFRLIALGVGLGVFSIVEDTWDTAERLPAESIKLPTINQWIADRLMRGETCRFRYHDGLTETD